MASKKEERQREADDQAVQPWVLHSPGGREEKEREYYQKEPPIRGQ